MKKMSLMLVVAMVFLSSMVFAADYLVCDPYPYAGAANQTVPKSFITNVDGVDQAPIAYTTVTMGTLVFAVVMDLTPLSYGEHTFKVKACSDVNGTGGCSEASIPFVWVKSAPIISPVAPKTFRILNMVR